MLPKDMTVADIFLRSGSIDEDQGSCIGGATAPAGNKFSHSHLGNGNHWDFRAVTSAMAPGLEINYRYHAGSGSPASMEPTKYTGMGSSGGTIFHPDPCTVVYTAASCPTINTVFPIKVAGIVEAPPAANYSFATMSDMQQQAAAFDQLASTDLGTIPTGISFNEMSEMTAQLEADPYMAEIEFWRSIQRAYQQDTTGSFPAEEIKILLDTYQPEVLERFTASLNEAFDLAPATWIAPAYTSVFSGNNATLGISISALPDSIDSETFELNYVLPYAAAQLHKGYIAGDKSYTPILNLEGLLSFTGKSQNTGCKLPRKQLRVKVECLTWEHYEEEQIF